MKDSELKARLSQAEVHFSHYRWDDAIASFEAVLAAHPDHPAAMQGWTSAVEQRTIDEELSLALSKARASLEAHRFEEALAILNNAQTRGALSHILKYHSEIDGLRSEAQEGQEWQRRIEAAQREAESLAARRRFEQALEVLDSTLRPLSGRGWEGLGAGLAALRERLWAERDVSERVQFAESAYERQDYRLATELAAALHEELPDREDVRRLHERARGAWGRIQDQLAAVTEAIAHERMDDAMALLASLRSEHPRNPDWQSIALRVHMDQGRQRVAEGRRAFVDHGFEDAAEALEQAHSAFTATVEIFPGHPTAAAEQAESSALRDAALFAAQADRDRVALRWKASRQGWQSSHAHLTTAIAVRERDFGEVVAVLDGMLGEAESVLAGLEQARLGLAEGREALAARDAGRARDAYRAGLGRVEAGRWADAEEVSDLREQLAAGLRESERIQREVKKLLGHADAVRAGARADERLSLLRRAHELWETAPGLSARLADELLRAASERAGAGDEDAALAFCEEVRQLSSAPAGALAAAGQMAVGIQARREVKAGLEKAATVVDSASRATHPSPGCFAEALAVLDAVEPALAEAREMYEQFAALRERAENAREAALAAEPLLAQSEALATAGEWRAAAQALAAAVTALGSIAGPELRARLDQLEAQAAAVDKALQPAAEALDRAEAAYAAAADGDLSAVDWDGLERSLAAIRKALRTTPEIPLPVRAAWHEARTRADGLARRCKVLRNAHEKVSAGKGAEAIPVLHDDAAASSDPVILAVLSRLLEETAGEASTVARGWLTQTIAAMGRGELGTAEAYLALAGSYAAAAPQVRPEIKRLEQQMARLSRIQSATSEAREHAAEGRLEAALVGYRRALELATDGEAGLPASARRKLVWLLGREDELEALGQLAGEGDRGAPPGRAPTEAWLEGDASDPLVGEFVAPALTRWWKLAHRAACLAAAAVDTTLGRDGTALAAGLLRSYPGDRAALELYVAATARTRALLLSKGTRRLERARRLAARGSYAEALAEISPEAMALAPEPASGNRVDQGEDVEALLDDVADLRAELLALQAASQQLAPLLDQMRQLAVAGDLERALEVRDQAGFVDPRRRAALVWEELDAIAGLIAKRQAGPRTPRASRPEASELRRAPQPREPEVAPAPVPSPAPGIEAPAPLADEAREAPSPAAPGAEPLNSRAAPPPEPQEMPAVSSAEEPAPAPQAEELEPPAPFDLNEWLSNVTELDPEDGDARNGS